jgi:hypothetical protein
MESNINSLSNNSNNNFNNNHNNNNITNTISHSNNANYSTKNNQNLPCITDNKKICIHKPSDFTKNKYTFLSSLANNSEILSLDNKKTYLSPRFSMKDIKTQIKREKTIIGSILKDEVDSLPSLLKNYISAINKNKKLNNIRRGKLINENLNGFNNIMLNNINNINNINNHNNINLKKVSDKQLKGFYSDAEQVAPRANGLINLNFLISSPKRKNNNFARNEANIKKISDNQITNIKINNHFNTTKTSIFEAKIQSRKYNHLSMDNSNTNGNFSKSSNFVINPKYNKSFKNYLNYKIASFEPSKGKLYLFIFLNMKIILFLGFKKSYMS